MFKKEIKVLIISFAIVMLLLALCVGYGVFLHERPKISQPKINILDQQKPTQPVACTKEAKVCPDGSTVARTGPNCEFEPCPEVDNIDTSDWQTYRNEEYGFEVKYPDNFFLKPSTQGIDISALSPNDPKRRTSIGIMSKISISIESTDVESIISKLEANEYEEFSVKEVMLNGLSAKKVVYEGVYSGEINHIILIRNNSNTYQITYSDSYKYQNIFEEIISTFKFLD